MTAIAELSDYSTIFLTVSLSVLRVFMVRSKSSINSTNPSVSYKIIICCILLSSFFCWHTLLARITRLDNQKEFKKICPLSNENITTSSFVMYETEHKANMVFDVFRIIFTHILPVIIIPIAALILVMKLKDVNNRRSRMSFTVKSNQITKLVIFMSIGLTTSEFRRVLSYIIYLSFDYFTYSYSSLIIMPYILAYMSMINAASHCFMCYYLCAQYRLTANEKLSEIYAFITIPFEKFRCKYFCETRVIIIERF
ncbi:unnamed protein product [Caenorhabditis angaria]|uniref:G-protein coupled receptors family 1 profile domain-containing protein n=1 Tax=Caenorhabditis angaria TaxID=860376 RepID=A0A9P1MVI2_9PELO|nr:unnamed protein product [Caenorhabditis angaria]